MIKYFERRPLTETIECGYFGNSGKGWPYEGMYDENNDLTSSVFGADIYRLNEGPPDLVHKEKVPRTEDSLELPLQSENDEAAQWLAENDPDI